jgi:HEAT repeat protein
VVGRSEGPVSLTLLEFSRQHAAELEMLRDRKALFALMVLYHIGPVSLSELSDELGWSLRETSEVHDRLLQRAMASKGGLSYIDFVQVSAAGRSLLFSLQLAEEPSREQIEFLVASLRHASDQVRRSAFRVLMHLADDAAPFLVNTWAREEDAVRADIAAILSCVTEPIPAASALIEMLGDANPQVRKHAASGLSLVRGKSGAVTSGLMPLLRDEHAAVRSAAALTLASYSAASTRFARDIAALLKDDRTAEAAVRALICMGPNAKPAQGALIRMLRHPQTSQNAAKCLNVISPDLELVIAVLLSILKSRSVDDVPSLANVVNQIQAVRAPLGSELMAMLQTGSQSERMKAASLLGIIGAREAVPFLTEMFGRSSQTERKSALRALVLITGAEARPTILIALKDRGDLVRLSAVEMLPDVMVGSELVRTLIESTRDRLPSIRSAAARVLGESFTSRLSWANAYGEDDPIPAVPVLAALLDDADSDVRQSAAMALGRIGPRAKGAIPALRNVLRDSNPNVRNVAAEAISRIERREPGTSSGSTEPSPTPRPAPTG